MNRIISVAIRVGWTATFFVGLAVMLAVVLGVGTTALAAVPGDPLKLGRLNALDALTQLVGNRAGALLVVDNDSNAAGSRALDLRVEPGRAPLTVNPEAGKATNLNTDEIDGQDSAAFMPTETYVVELPLLFPKGSLSSFGKSCDPGDKALSGGWADTNPDTQVLRSQIFAPNPANWSFSFQNRSATADDNLTVNVNCADLPPLH